MLHRPRCSQRCLCRVMLVVFCSTLPAAGHAQDPSLAELAKQVAVPRPASQDQLQHCLRCFVSATFQDPRIHAFHVDARLDGTGAVRVTGYVEFVEIQAALLDYLRLLGFDRVQDHTTLLPDAELGPTRFGFVQSAHGFVRAEPAEEAEVVTDAVLGEPLYLLLARNGFLLCHTGEGYLGYLHARHVRRVTEGPFQDYQAGRQLRVRQDLALGDILLPAGARLKWVADNDTQMIVETPDGRKLLIPAEQADVLPETPDPRVDRALQVARAFVGTPYVWGGKTSAGADCSGLVQASFAAGGLHLPRDANQQLLAGRLTATRWYRQGLRRGDTLYFLGSSGRVSHTGIYLGRGQFVEAVRPQARVSSLNRDDANYSERADLTFAFGKRLVD